MVYEEAEQPRAARDDAPYEHDNEELAPRNLNFGATLFDLLPRLLAVDIRRWRSRSVLSRRQRLSAVARLARPCGRIRPRADPGFQALIYRSSESASSPRSAPNLRRRIVSQHHPKFARRKRFQPAGDQPVKPRAYARVASQARKRAASRGQCCAQASQVPSWLWLLCRSLRCSVLQCTMLICSWFETGPLLSWRKARSPQKSDSFSSAARNAASRLQARCSTIFSVSSPSLASAH